MRGRHEGAFRAGSCSRSVRCSWPACAPPEAVTVRRPRHPRPRRRRLRPPSPAAPTPSADRRLPSRGRAGRAPDPRVRRPGRLAPARRRAGRRRRRLVHRAAQGRARSSRSGDRRHPRDPARVPGPRHTASSPARTARRGSPTAASTRSSASTARPTRSARSRCRPTGRTRTSTPPSSTPPARSGSPASPASTGGSTRRAARWRSSTTRRAAARTASPRRPAATSGTRRWPAATSPGSITTTGAATVVEPPTAGQGARRVWSDSRGRIWVSEWDAGQVGVHDPATGDWQEWRLPGERPAGLRRLRRRARHRLADRLRRRTRSSGSIRRPRRSMPIELPSPDAAVRQLLGRPGEVWGAESAVDKLVLVIEGCPNEDDVARKKDPRSSPKDRGSFSGKAVSRRARSSACPPTGRPSSRARRPARRRSGSGSR